MIWKQEHIVSISWGINTEILSISTVLNQTLKVDILIFTSASNTNTNYQITFPTQLNGILCIDSTDSLGTLLTFNPSFEKKEKYSALNEAVLGASLNKLSDQLGYNSTTQMIRRDRTSTVTPITAGLIALLINYMW